MTASLAYRTNTAAILAGNPPIKYTRILPHIPGQNILEIGSAEGVLACLMAKSGKSVTAVEKSADRHEQAAALSGKWDAKGLFKHGGQIKLVNASADEALHLTEPGDFDTLVAVRVIYYFREQMDEIFAQIAAKVPNVVLCGNRNRADRWRAGRPHEGLGEFNYYASLEGMKDVLERHGYQIVSTVTEGDEIVIGKRV